MSGSEDELDIVALVLSFIIPGVGQIYQGRTRVGVLFIVAMLISGALTFVLIGFLLLPIVWAINMYDVYAEWLDV